MQFITDIFVAFVVGYLSFTNMLADRILYFLGAETEIATYYEDQKTSVPEAAKGSNPRFFGESQIITIPDVLLRNLSYQQATALTPLEPSTHTTNPLEALVNIYCTSRTSRTIRTTTGTGFFVHDKGVILTNAHVAQYLLLQHTDMFGRTTCTVRTGNPAAPRYIAELLYLPPSWIITHGSSLTEEAPVGTGERDYALLYVTKGVDGSALPEKFPALALQVNQLNHAARGMNVIASGYPAEMLLRGETTSLIPKSAPTRINEIYTFRTNTPDVFSVQGSAVGQQGSSGGPITNERGQVIGLIATRGDDTLDGQGSLRAITMSHIDKTMIEETGFSLARNISGNVVERGQLFNNAVVPLLTELLTLQISTPSQ